MKDNTQVSSVSELTNAHGTRAKDVYEEHFAKGQTSVTIEKKRTRHSFH